VFFAFLIVLIWGLFSTSFVVFGALKISEELETFYQRFINRCLDDIHHVKKYNLAFLFVHYIL